MADLFTGAVVGALLAEVIIVVKGAVNTIQQFKPRLEKIHLILTHIEPVVNQMITLSKQMGKPNHELMPIQDVLEECKCLAIECCEVHGRWNPAVTSLSKKLVAVEERLQWFLTTLLPSITSRNVMELLSIAYANNMKSGSNNVAVELECAAEVQSVQVEETNKMPSSSSVSVVVLQPEEKNNTEKTKKSGRFNIFGKKSKKSSVLQSETEEKLLHLDKLNSLNDETIVNSVKEDTLLSELKAELAKELERRDLDKMNRISIELVSEMTPDKARLLKSYMPASDDFVVGYDSSLRYIKEKLLTGEEPVIVITGGGGYGKTALVTKLCHDEQVTGKFKDIITVIASKSNSLMTVIQQIITHFGREGISDYDTLTEVDAVQFLHQLLAERAKLNPILLVLDDLGYGLSKIVKGLIPNCTVLVTSRSELPGIGCSHKLKGLEHEDAVKLLRHTASPLNCNNSLPNDAIIDQVAQHCKGSPLALKVVGESLYGKSKVAWEVKLKNWSNGLSFCDNNYLSSKIRSSLMSSLEGVEDIRVKNCFLDLGSFPEDKQICVAALVDMWSVLYGTGEDAIAAIIELSARNLVDVITTSTREDMSLGDGYYNNMHVMQIDVLLRDLTIHLNTKDPIQERERLNLTIRKNNLPEWLLKEQKQPFNARVVSICTDEEFRATWPDLELPAAEALVLNFRVKDNYDYTLPSFINKMVNLKILIVINNGPLPVKLRNFHLIASLPNLKKIRLEKIKIEKIYALDNLEKISAFLCDISDEIQSTDVQIHEMFPKLEEIDISYCGNLKTLPNRICEADTLKKISITNCHNLSQLPEEIGNLLDLQVLRLYTCTDLERLPSSIVDVENLRVLDISNCVSIAQLPERIGELQQLKELHLSRCSNLSSLPSSAKRLNNLEYLIIDNEQVKFKRFFKGSHKLKVKVGIQRVSLNFMG